MAEQRDPQSPRDDDEDIRRGLLRRVAVAGVVVVILLGGLAVFDAMNAPPTERPGEVAVASPAKADDVGDGAKERRGEVTEPTEKSDSGESPEKLADATPPPPERTAAPESSGSLTHATPATPSASLRPASIRPSEAVMSLQRGEATARIESGGGKHAPPSRPLSRAAEASRQYVLQMGVFSNLANAEELRAKLELAGIPTHVEARVHVGPFASRAEAEAAKEKLRDIGMDGGLLTTLRR